MAKDKPKKSLAHIRADLLKYIEDIEHIPDEYKPLILPVVSRQFNLISQWVGTIELVFRRTRDYPDIETRHEKKSKRGDV